MLKDGITRLLTILLCGLIKIILMFLNQDVCKLGSQCILISMSHQTYMSLGLNSDSVIHIIKTVNLPVTAPQRHSQSKYIKQKDINA